MAKILVPLLWLLFPIPICARQPQCPSLCAPAYPSAPNRQADLFSRGNPGTRPRALPSLWLQRQDGKDDRRFDGPSRAPGEFSPGSPQKNRPPAPHMIELTSANWRPLTRREKLTLFDRDLLHWETHASLLLDAGIASATGDREFLGTGARGFFSIYGLNAADELNFTFFNAYLFPAVFHQDPRYIPSDRGTTKARIFYAVSRIAVTRGDSGKAEFNKSKILGTVLATSISSAYYAGFGANVGIGGNFASIGINLASDAAFDLLKEFWPDAARKLKVSIWIRNLVRAAIRDRVRVG